LGTKGKKWRNATIRNFKISQEPATKTKEREETNVQRGKHVGEETAGKKNEK